jgi:hydroxyacylglutathione hydrolase
MKQQKSRRPRSTIRRVFQVFAGLVLLMLIGLVALFASVFIGNRQLEDGAVLNGHGVTVNDGYVAVFLLPTGEGKFALIDCGNDPEAHALKAVLAQKGATEAAVEAIFLTHGHPDHIAGCNAFPKAVVYGFAEDAKMAKGEEASQSPMGRLVGKQKAKTVEIKNRIEDGSEIQVGDLSVRAYRVPGHTQGSGVYLARGVLYLGDTLKSKPDGTLADAPWMFSDNLTQNDASLKGLAERLDREQADVKILALSHTGALEGIGPLKTFVEQHSL